MTDERTEMDRHKEGGASVDSDNGRPSGPTDADGLRAGQGQAEAPTEAPEEKGADPATEHAPGGDL